MNVGDKVWVNFGGWGLSNPEAEGWAAVVAAVPEGVPVQRGKVFVRDENFEVLYRVNKSDVKERND